MSRFYFFILLNTFLINHVTAQITFAAEDSILFEKKLTQLKSIQTPSLGDSIVFVGKSFLDIPYVEKTLEVGAKESLVINLRGLDCTTFVENVLAFGLQIKEDEKLFMDFAKNLETIRYRNGELNGYPSRLHYFTEWIRNNQTKGLVQDITSEIGGEIIEKSINFMGTHRNLYPFLADDTNYNEILKVESDLAKESLCILPQNKIEGQEAHIQNGDIIALATSIKGLDVTHTGFAIRVNDRIHLLHASTSGSVTITEEPLTDYLKKIKSNTGIIVARPTLLSSQTP
ncbi:N-acetylmuramoyl-L-alanine amidase-like domain-containing protein [Flagellimonas sp. S174]|uniref:N-acetylmuramoyl-L-alanine amidase-like domain-containing protein n=1 Tax=Flagellimonas sp. S174 TaxID=3410790 RepID=UPI003BF48845